MTTNRIETNCHFGHTSCLKYMQIMACMEIKVRRHMMRITFLLFILVLGIFSIAGAIVPDLFIDGVALDPAQYRLNGEDEDLQFRLESNVQNWSLLSDIPLNTSARPSFGLFTRTDITPPGGYSSSVLFDGFSSNFMNVPTNYSEGTDVGFWLSKDYNGKANLSKHNSMLFSERALSIGDKERDKQSFLMYDVRNFKDSDYSYGNWSGNGNYDYLIFIEDKQTDGIDHDDMVVGLMVAPEPSTLFLLASGLLGTGLALRRNRKQIK